MKVNNLIRMVWIVFASMVFIACESDYSRLVKEELASGKIYTNFLFDLEVGDTKKEFFAKCWQLNADKKISQGSGNKYAKFIQEPSAEEDSLARVVTLFYGIFDEKEIMQGVEMKMSFYSWSPWNEEYTSDKLMDFMKIKYERTLGGNPFIEIPIENMDTKAFVKVDGNRQIRMHILSPQEIMVKIEDLRHKVN